MPCNMMSDATSADFAMGKAHDLERELRKVEAMLCGLILSLTRDNPDITGLLSRVDYARSGVTRAELEQWWESHRKRDVFNLCP